MAHRLPFALQHGPPVYEAAAPAAPAVDPMLDLESLKYHVERHPDQHPHFSFSVKFEHVTQRSVLRSLDYEDETGTLWGVRCVPLGHRALLYLLRSSTFEYSEFEYDFSIVNGLGEAETGFGRRAFVPMGALGEEFLDPALDIPVHPQRNWFIVHVHVRRLHPERDFWFRQPGEPSQNHPQQQQAPVQEMPNAGAEAEEEAAALEPDALSLSTQLSGLKLKHLDEESPSFPSFSRRLLTLFVDETFADCQVVTDSASFPAHKAILSAHSVVFRSMFAHPGTRESQTSSVAIPDLVPEAVLVTLQWFYTGELVPLDDAVAFRFLPLNCRLSNVPERSHPLDFLQPTPATPARKPAHLDTDVVEDVVRFAHRYALDDLEYLGEQVLSERVDVPNCARLAFLADLLQLFALRLACISTFKENVQQVKASEGWSELVRRNPDLAHSLEQQTTS